MHVGLCEVTFYFHGARTPREKRGQVRRLIDRVRTRFAVSIAETAEQESAQRARLGIALVGQDRRDADMRIDQVVQFMDELFLGERIGLEREVLSWKGVYE